MKLTMIEKVGANVKVSVSQLHVLLPRVLDVGWQERQGGPLLERRKLQSNQPQQV
jgi:hypothetical protein